MNLIIVNGHPASGKTSISNALAECLDIELISRDAIKERLYDERVGMKPADMTPVAWNKLLGGESYELLFAGIREKLSSGESVVIESPLDRDLHSSIFQEILTAHPAASAIQLLLHCDTDELKRRFVHRFENGERHPTHVDNEYYHRFDKGGAFSSPREALDIEGALIRLDTTDFSTIDSKTICAQVQKAMHTT